MYFKKFLAILVLGGSVYATIQPQRRRAATEVSCSMKASIASSCGELCIMGYRDASCTRALTSITLSDTAGVKVHLGWPSNSSVQVKSIQYWGATTLNSTGCDPLQFSFYNSLGQYAGVAYLKPGQWGGGCVGFANETAVSYSGVTLLVPVPEGLTGVGQAPKGEPTAWPTPTPPPFQVQENDSLSP